MNNICLYLVVKDEDGVLRPMAGVWKDNEAGRIASVEYLKKNNDCTIVRVEINERYEV